MSSRVSLPSRGELVTKHLAFISIPLVASWMGWWELDFVNMKMRGLQDVLEALATVASDICLGIPRQ
jgi:hypothetical protein